MFEGHTIFRVREYSPQNLVNNLLRDVLDYSLREGDLDGLLDARRAIVCSAVGTVISCDRLRQTVAKVSNPINVRQHDL